MTDFAMHEREMAFNIQKLDLELFRKTYFLESQLCLYLSLSLLFLISESWKQAVL